MRGGLGGANKVNRLVKIASLTPCKSKKQMDRARNGARYFRNPPQPHMCVQDFIQGSDRPCYINVMSWMKIVTPQSTEDSIPLYGGMRVLPGSSSQKSHKKHPLIFAVMANPEILKVSGKTAKNPSDRDWLIEVMLDFIEAMNPDVHFKRQFSVLKDRDLTGELKDIWLAVHLMRERDRSEGVKGRDVVGPEGEWLQVAYETEVTLSVEDSDDTADVATVSCGNSMENVVTGDKHVSSGNWLFVSHETEVSSTRNYEVQEAMSEYGTNVEQKKVHGELGTTTPSSVSHIKKGFPSSEKRSKAAFIEKNGKLNIMGKNKISCIPSSSKSSDMSTSPLRVTGKSDIVTPSTLECLNVTDCESNYKTIESQPSVVNLDHAYTTLQHLGGIVCGKKKGNGCNKHNGCDKTVERRNICDVEDLQRKEVPAEQLESQKHRDHLKKTERKAICCLQAKDESRICQRDNTVCRTSMTNELPRNHNHLIADNDSSSEQQHTVVVRVSVP